jgi:hypothetical protein
MWQFQLSASSVTSLSELTASKQVFDIGYTHKGGRSSKNGVICLFILDIPVQLTLYPLRK